MTSQQELESNAIIKGKLQFLTKMAYTLAETDVLDEINIYQSEWAKQVSSRYAKLINDQKGYRYYLITICPPNDTEFSVLREKCEKILTKKWITHFSYTFEQRSEDPGFYEGYHCHMLLDRHTKRPSEVKREIRSTCQGWNIDFKGIKDSLLDRPMAYIHGIKKDPEKQKKIDNDTNFRNYFDLEDSYDCTCSDDSCPLSWKDSDANPPN